MMNTSTTGRGAKKSVGKESPAEGGWPDSMIVLDLTVIVVVVPNIDGEEGGQVEQGYCISFT